MEETLQNWEEVYEELQTSPYNEVLDQEFETNRYYEVPWMIRYFKENEDEERADFMLKLEKQIEEENGRVLSIEDKFILENDQVKCVVEITDFDENSQAFIEYSEIEYRTDKKEISNDFNIYELERKY